MTQKYSQLGMAAIVYLTFASGMIMGWWCAETISDKWIMFLVVTIVGFGVLAAAFSGLPYDPEEEADDVDDP